MLGLSLLVLLFCGHVIQSIAALKKLRWRLSHTQQENAQIQALLDTVKERTEKLQASEGNYRSLLHMSADAIILIDHDGIVRFLNPAAEELFVQPGDKLLGRPFPFPVTPE